MNRWNFAINPTVLFRRQGLSLGSSKHWRDALEILTGEKNLNAGAMVEYFKPLYDYLREENGNNGDDNDDGDDESGAPYLTTTNIIGCVVIATILWVL